MNGDVIEVHYKVWGEEHWIVNSNYCGKKLVLKKGYRCSIHFHEQKDETFYVVTGIVLMEVNKITRVLYPGMKQHIPPLVKHRFTGLERSEIIEFSTHHSDTDSYRDTQSGEVPSAEFAALRLTYL